MVVTVRELDDLLREDVRRELEQLHHALPVYAIDINDPFSSRLFGTGWDDPQMAGYACWYNLQQIFSWLAAMGWQVILHTGVTTRSDLLQRFLQLAANHFPPATLNSWRFVWHWSPQASEAARRPPGGSSAGSFIACCRSRSWGSGTALLPAIRNDPLFHSPLLAEADFLACRADANEQLDLARADSRRGLQRTLSATQAAADPQRPAPASAQPAAVAALTEYADRRYAGYQRPLFRGALLMDNLLGVADGLAGGLLVKFRPRGRSSRQRQARYLQPGAALSARPAAPGLLGTLALAAAARRITVHDKTCCCSTTGSLPAAAAQYGGLQSTLSSEAAFIQRFSQPYSVRLQGTDGSWRIKQHLFDQHHGALFPLVDAFRSRSGLTPRIISG